VTVRPELSPHPDDSRIVDSARATCQRLNLPRIQPKTVSWTPRMRPDLVTIFRDEIWLPEKMQAKLTPDDWTPLVASSLAYYGRIYRKTLGVALKNFMIPNFLAVLILVFVILRVFPNNSSLIIIITTTIWIIGYLANFAFWQRRYQRAHKELWLEADAKATELYGTELLRVLQKIRDSGVETTRRRRIYYSLHPTLTERINRLESKLH
jgi:hypothetical protein